MPLPAPCLSLKQLGLLYKLSHAGHYKVLFISTTPSPPTCPLPPPQIPHHFLQLHSHSQTLIITLPNLMHHHHLPTLTVHLLFLVLRIIHPHPHPHRLSPRSSSITSPPCTPVTELSLTSSTGTGSQHLRVGCLNTRGFKANTYYTHQLLN